MEKKKESKAYPNNLAEIDFTCKRLKITEENEDERKSVFFFKKRNMFQRIKDALVRRITPL